MVTVMMECNIVAVMIGITECHGVTVMEDIRGWGNNCGCGCRMLQSHGAGNTVVEVAVTMLEVRKRLEYGSQNVEDLSTWALK